RAPNGRQRASRPCSPRGEVSPRGRRPALSPTESCDRTLGGRFGTPHPLTSGALMASPHLLRPYTAAQLSLVSGDERVAVFAVLSGRHAGPSVLVHVPTARSRLDWLASQVEVVVFVDEPIPEPAT